MLCLFVSNSTFKTFERDVTSGPSSRVLISVAFYENPLGKHSEMRSRSEAVSEVTGESSLGSGPISAVYKLCDLGQVI